MNSLQYDPEVPAIEFHDDLLSGMWQSESNPASMYHQNNSYDNGLHDSKQFYQHGPYANTYPMRLPLPPMDSYWPMSTTQPSSAVRYEETDNLGPFGNQFTHRSNLFAAHQHPVLAYDHMPPVSDSSDSPESETSNSPPPSLGHASYRSEDHGFGTSPITPLSSIHGEGASYPYHSYRHPSLGSNKSVTMKEIQYEHDLDAQNAAHQEEMMRHPEETKFKDEEEDDEADDDENMQDDELSEQYNEDIDDKDSEYTPNKRTSSYSKRLGAGRRDNFRPVKFMATAAIETSSRRSFSGVSKSKSQTTTTQHSTRQRRRSSATTVAASTLNQLQNTPSQHHHHHSSPTQTGGDSKAQQARRFICPFSHYSCPSRFANKNEWKRHVSSQHLQLGFYRCDIGDCNPGPSHHHPHKSSTLGSSTSSSTGSASVVYNDFNRKDLFTQHLRRMHSPWRQATQNTSSSSSKQPTLAQKQQFESTLEGIRQRCYTKKRNPPTRSVCGFCSRVFEGEGGGGSSWDERMEHVGRHLETQNTSSVVKTERKGKKGGVKREVKDEDSEGEDEEVKAEENGEGEEVVGEEEDEDLREWALSEGIIRPCSPDGNGRTRGWTLV